MGQSLQYVSPTATPSNFQECPLLDGNGNNFGNLYLCNGNTRINTTTIPSPVSASGAPFPGPPSDTTTFPDVFLQLASTIAQCVTQMNQQLMALHILSINGNNYSGTTTPKALMDGLNAYTVAAAQLCQALGWGLPGQKRQSQQFWPLVPFNPRWDLTVGSAWVTNQNIPNTNFKPPTNQFGPPEGSGWPDHTKALYLYSMVPGDVNQNAIGTIEFWQDCEWLQNSNNKKDWSSWGFITNFGLTLFEFAQPGLGGGISSSSSSSYYAASSASPGPITHKPC